jgi:hypothetical protein
MQEMLTNDLQKEISDATVKILKKEGQGALVGGGLILTAAHCIDFECPGGMALGDYYIENIRTIHGQLKVAPLAGRLPLCSTYVQILKFL